jgi:purine nucleosidase
MKLWIDTDAGVDDSTAILLALTSENVEIVGISAVSGNTALANVIRNINRTLNVFSEATKSIPIYPGCDRAIIQPHLFAPEFHGSDGLGDIKDSDFGIENMPIRIEEKHGVNAIIDAAKLYGKELTLLTLGPLTNIALAIRMDPSTIAQIGRLVVMGGAEDGVGNTNPWAEFNVRCDPEAAHIVFGELPGGMITMVSWTLTRKYVFSSGEAQGIFDHLKTILGRWLNATWRVGAKLCQGSLLMADPLASYVCCCDGAVTEYQRMKIETVLNGPKIGMTSAVNSEDGVTVVTGIDRDKFKDALFRMMNHH